MADKKFWGIRADEQLIDRLTKLGARLGYPSGNAFAADVLNEWAELLAEITAELKDDRAASKKRIHERVMSQLRSERRK